MKVKYVGKQVGTVGLDSDGVYDVLEIDELCGALRIVDESGEDYLYHPQRPKTLDQEYQGGRFEIVEDDEAGSLKKAIYG